MTTLITKTTTAVSKIALFAIGCVMAGLGLAMMSMLALFALFTIGLAFLAAPFVAAAQSRSVQDAQTTEDATFA